MPVLGLQVPVVLHGAGAAHVTGLLPVHTPLTHAIACRHLFVIWHGAQVAPAVPHSLVLCAVVTHPELSQHPNAHDAALHATHAPP